MISRRVLKMGQVEVQPFDTLVNPTRYYLDASPKLHLDAF